MSKPRFGARSLGLMYEASQSLRGRTVRTWMTAIGIALGIAATIATIGLSETASNAISDKFDETKAITVQMDYTKSLRDQGFYPTVDTTERVRDINGVAATGFFCGSTQEQPIERTPGADLVRNAKVWGLEPSVFDTYEFTILKGRSFDYGHLERDDKVALISDTIARDYGYIELDTAPLIYIAGEAHTVMGIFKAPEGETKFSGSVVVPPTACSKGDENWDPATVYIRTDLGAARKVHEFAPLAILPEAPEQLKASKPVDLESFRQGVENEMQGLLLGLAAVSLVIGAVSVSNTSLVSVMERRSEIGLRRAVGAPRRAIAMQFVWESAIVGIIGGVVGTVIGLDTIAGVSLIRDWQIVFPMWLLIGGPILGTVVGMFAGVYPAWRASRVPPAVTLRS